MLRALMASASGCITLSLALHATLLWGASGHERIVERHAALDTVTDAIALDFETERLGDERSTSAPGGAESSTAEEIPDVAPVARPRPVPAARPARRAEERTTPKHAAERTVETPAAPEPQASPAPPVTSSPSPATPSASTDAAGAGGAAPGVVSTLSGGANPAGGGSASAGSAHGDGVGSMPGGGFDAAAQRAALLDYARRVRARIAEQREYPYAARRARLHGTVCLRIELAASGRLLEAEPTCGSSLGPLAKAALAAVAKASPFPPLPTALGSGLTLDVPVIFELED